ncbi:MAG TPA: PKD domain-containing protein [bacterium]
MTRTLLVTSLAILFAMVIGCSGNTGSPVVPNNSNNIENNPNDQVDLTTPDQPSAQYEMTEGHSLFGYYEISINPDTYEVEFVPLRTSEMHLNLVPMLEGASMNIGLAGPPSVSNGVLTVDIIMTHPFPGKDNFSGFDVKGIFISNGSETGFSDPAIKIAGPHETRLINADGFTRWWNPAEFMGSGILGYQDGKLGSVMEPSMAATLNGYKLFADGLGAVDSLADLDPATRALFRAGESNTRSYQISLASGLKFNYAVDCSWASPTVKPPVNLPDDFPMEANQAEPWNIQVVEDNNTLWFADDEHGGNVSYTLTVKDWQGMDGNGVLMIESPGLFSDSALGPDEVLDGAGIYHFNFILPELASADDLDVLISVAVKDGNYDPGLTGVDAALKGYHRHITDVSPTNPIFNQPPVALMEATTTTEIYTGYSVKFDASASYDSDGLITDYQWDFNGDGIYGDTYASGNDISPSKIYQNPGTYLVKLKVIDDKSTSATSDPVTVIVTLETNDPPVAIAEATSETNILEDNTISFDASASYDVDGVITNYQWDFNGDGLFGDPYNGDPMTPTAMFANPGVFMVDLRVVDDEGGVDTLDTKIEVNIEDVPNVGPTASAEATTSTDINLCGQIDFDATASMDSDGSIAEYLWDFNGDGTYGDAYTGDPSMPTAMFNTPGSFDVMMKVVDDEGAEDMIDAPIPVMITNDLPVAGATSDVTDIYGGDSVTFDATSSSDANSACGDSVVDYSWDFDGDGVFEDSYDSGDDINPVKMYSSNGTFEVSLRVTDSFGGEDDLDTPITINVQNHPPIGCVEITSEMPYMFETDIDFSAQCSEDPDGSITNYEWDLNVDGSYEETGMNVQYYFADAGVYTMQLRLTDNESAQSLLTDPFQFTIFDDTNMPPEITSVNHSRTTSQVNNNDEAVSLSVDFTDPIPPGDTHTFLWTCADGSFDDPTSATPIWYPDGTGAYKTQITVKVTDGLGMFDEGTCNQWVTTLAVANSNPNSTDEMLLSATLQTIYGVGPINPTSYSATNFGGDGNVVYLNFWATWCGPCVSEMPTLKNIYHTYKSYDFVQFFCDEDGSEDEAWVTNWNSNNGYTEDDCTAWVIQCGTYYQQNAPWAGAGFYIPLHVLADRDGQVRWSQFGSLSSEALLTNKIDELI